MIVGVTRALQRLIGVILENDTLNRLRILTAIEGAVALVRHAHLN